MPICTFLIESGANVYQRFNNKSPEDLALEKEQTTIWRLINEKITRSDSSQADPVSAHLGYQPGHNLQYNDVDHLISQPYVHEHDANVPLYLPTATDTQYMDPRQLGTWDQQLRP